MLYYKRTLLCGNFYPSINNIFSKKNGNWLEIFLSYNSKVYFIHRARIGIKHVCNIINITEADEVLMPSYNCGTEIDPFIHSRARVILYDITKEGKINLNDLLKKITSRTRIIYVVHYFGFPHNLNKIKSICDEKKIYLFEDCAVSSFTNVEKSIIGLIGDFSIYNFPKFIPVPDGGALRINRSVIKLNSWDLVRPSIMVIFRNILPFFKRYFLNIISKILPALIKKYYEYKANSEQKEEELYFNPEMPSNYYYNSKLNNTNISKISWYLLKRFDIEDIINTRRKNFLKYLELLSNNPKIVILYNKLPEGVCPLGFPVIVKKRRYVYRYLKSRSIESIEWWAGYHRDLYWDEFPNAIFLKNSLLLLPVHHHISIKHIEYIAKCISEAVSGFIMPNS